MYDHLRPDRGLDPPSRLAGWSAEERDWAASLRRAADWLALGSGFLLLWLLPVPAASALCVPIYLGALALHGVGWCFLGAGAVRAPGNALRAALVSLFVASLAAFSYAFLMVIPGEPGILRFLFPVLPEAWVPVVACHAVLFLLVGTTARDGGAAGWIAAGAMILAVLASGGAFVWSTGLSRSPPYVALLLPGMTALGYVCIRIGLRKLGEDAESGRSIRNVIPGPPSDGRPPSATLAAAPALAAEAVEPTPPR